LFLLLGSSYLDRRTKAHLCQTVSTLSLKLSLAAHTYLAPQKSRSVRERLENDSS